MPVFSLSLIGASRHVYARSRDVDASRLVRNILDIPKMMRRLGSWVGGYRNCAATFFCAYLRYSGVLDMTITTTRKLPGARVATYSFSDPFFRET